MPVESEFPAGTARGKKYRRLIAEESAQRIKTLGRVGANLNHGRGGNAGVCGNILEVATDSNGAGTQNGDGVRQILNFAQQVARQQNGGTVFCQRTDQGTHRQRDIGIEPVGRLIQQEQSGGAERSAGNV